MQNKTYQKKYTDFIAESLKYIPSYEKMDILEVGVGSLTDSCSHVLHEVYKPKSIIGIDHGFEDKEIAPNFNILKQDIRSTTFTDNQFDCILSIAVFEHVRLLDLALEEMYRILKPGGKVFSIFGPIYSSPVGHHLWVKIQGVLYTYNDLNIPPYAHLLHNQEEFTKLIVNKGIAPEVHARIISDWIYNVSDQNRYFFNDYERFFNESKFKVKYFKGTKSFPNLNRLLDEDLDSVQQKLKERYPDIPTSAFDANSIIVCLEK